MTHHGTGARRRFSVERKGFRCLAIQGFGMFWPAKVAAVPGVGGDPCLGLIELRAASPRVCPRFLRIPWLTSLDAR
jgi:hypothetical protein